MSMLRQQIAFFLLAILSLGNIPFTMSSNAEKFLEAAATFPEDALPDNRVYEHPLVQRYATKEMSFVC